MQEGPFLLFQRNRLQRFKGKTVSEASGTNKMDKSAINFIKLLDIEAFGEKLFFVFKDFFVSINLGNSGSILVNKNKKVEAQFSLHFPHSEINFYNAETQLYQGKPTDYFNFKIDILKKDFDPEFILEKLKTEFGDQMIGDVLLNQNIFAGVGNVIRTEALYHAKIHPESIIKEIPEKKLNFLLKIMVDYAEELLNLMKTDDTKDSTIIYDKKICPKDKSELLIEEMGIAKNKTFVCLKCQKIFK